MPGTPESFVPQAVGAALAAGHLAVSAFIVISGFSLGLTITRQMRTGSPIDWRRFFYRRARRILPPYWAATVFATLLLLTTIGEPTGTIWDVVLPFSWDQLPRTLLLTDDIRSAGVNHVFWSIAVEWHLYFLFPALVWLLLRCGPVLMAVLGVAGGTVLQLTAVQVTLGGMTLQYLGLLAMGLAASRWAAQRPEGTNRFGPVAATFLGAGLLLGWGYGLEYPAVLVSDPVFGIGVTALLLHLRLADRSRLRDLLGHPWFEWTGHMSYTTYLVHAPLLQVTWQLVVRPLDTGVLPSFGVLLLASLPLVYGGGYLFHLAFERPFMSAPARPTQLRGPAEPGPAARDAAPLRPT